MSFAFTPSYTFDGSNHDTSDESYSSGDDVYDEFGIDEIGISGSFLTVNFKDASSMSAWRGSDRSITLEHTGTGSKSWEDTYDVTTSDEYSVNTSFNYIHYQWTNLGLSTTEANDLADTVSSNGTGSSVLNINNFG